MLREFNQQGELSENMNEMVMQLFDRQVNENFRTLSRGKPIKLIGKKTNYNGVNDTWIFRTKEVDIKGEDNFQEYSDYCEIISTNARNNRIEPLEEEKPKKAKKRNRSGLRWCLLLPHLIKTKILP